MNRRSRSLGENALRFQLDAAKQRITSLEGYIRDRERSFQTALPRSHGDYQEPISPTALSGIVSQRRRRTGRVHDTLMTLRSMGGSLDEGEQETVIFQSPLGEFISLKLVKANETDGASIPFIIRRLLGHEYHVGPDGVTMGTSSNCTIRLPIETEMMAEHCCIEFFIPGKGGREGSSSGERRPMTEVGNKRDLKLFQQQPFESSGQFVLKDLTGGKGVMYLPNDSSTRHQLDVVNEEASLDGDETRGTFPLVLSSGMKFVTGKLVWCVVALPADVLLSAKMFYLAEHGDLVGLKKLIEGQDPQLGTPPIPKLTITAAEDSLVPALPTCLVNIPISDSSYDVNIEYKPPVYEEDERFIALLSSRKASGPFSSVLTTPITAQNERPHLLLHVAISNSDTEMVKYLLEKEADVNKCSGRLQYSATHLAALTNNKDIMALLMQHGADLEIRNSENLTPLALTTSYEIRKMLLNSVLLCAAADAGDIEEVTRLLTTTLISPRVKGLRHKSALHLAASEGHSDVVELLVINGADVNQKGGSRLRTPLHYASQGGHTHIVQLLLSAGANEFSRDIGGYTPLNLCKGDACRLLNKQPMSLCLAVQSGDEDSIRKILEDMQLPSGIEEEDNVIDLRNEQGHAPLHLAAIMGSLPIVQLLVSFGGTVDIPGGSDSWTPLFYAAMAGHSDLVEFLLAIGADPEACDKNGNTVKQRVQKAVEEASERMSRLKQRERSESVVETNMLGRLSVNMLRQESSPSCSVESELRWQSSKLEKLFKVLPLLTSFSERLTSALDCGNISEFISVLETSKVSPTATSDLQPILTQACEDGLVPFVRALLDYGVEPGICALNNEMPLLVAARNGHESIVKLLVESGAGVNTQSSDLLSTALHEAASMNELSTVHYLLSIGADRDIINTSGEKPFDCTKMLEIQQLLATGSNCLLAAACANDPGHIIQLVTVEGLAVDTEFFRNGYTTLHQACEIGFEEVVSTLLDLGANPNKKGGSCMSTPLHVASENDHLEIAKMLLAKGAKVDIKDYSGKVPFEIATSNKMRRVLVESRLTRPPPPVDTTKPNTSDSSKLCLICMDNPINTIILPCGHQTFCTDCATQITECALDRKTIREVIPVYK